MTSTQRDEHPGQHPGQHLEIRRSEEIDLDELDDLRAVWDLMSTAEGWASWLVDEARLHIAPGRAGTARDDGRERIVRIDTVIDRERVGFSWWDRDDPDSASYVELDLVRLDSHRARIDISERFTGTVSMSSVMTSAMSSAARRAGGLRWEAKLLLLCLMAMPVRAKA